MSVSDANQMFTGKQPKLEHLLPYLAYVRGLERCFGVLKINDIEIIAPVIERAYKEFESDTRWDDPTFRREMCSVIGPAVIYYQIEMMKMLVGDGKGGGVDVG
jgi:hypothetical protein